MQELKEHVLLRKVCIYFLVPGLLLGMLGFFMPFFYALVPAHESGDCICNVQAFALQLDLVQLSKKTLLILNTTMFYAVNWVFLLVLVLMLYRIRHIRDKLAIREEMAYQTATWTFFCVIQYFLFLCEQINLCQPQFSPILKQAYIYSYYVMVGRDLVMLVIISSFIFRVAFDPKTVKELQGL